MSSSPKFGGPGLDKCAIKRKTLLKDKDSKCVLHVRLTDPVSAWRMDHADIISAAKDAAKADGGKRDSKKQRCDFAIYQAKNPSDERSHLVLVECKKTFRGNEQDMEQAYGQLVDGLRVLRHMAGERRFFRFDILTPIYVYNRAQVYRGAVMSTSMNSTLHKLQIEYNGRRARIKVKRTDVEIDDQLIAVRDAR